MDKVIKHFLLEVKSADEEERVLTVIGSTESTDRDKDQILVDGWDLKAFKKNPVIMFGHNYSGLPVARADRVWIDADKKALMFKVRFPEEGSYELSDTLWKLYSKGFMKASSVGFLPLEWEWVKQDEKSKKDKPVRIFKKQELLELSLVSIPANPDALVQDGKSVYRKAIDDGVVTEEELNHLIENDQKIFDLEANGEQIKDTSEQSTYYDVILGGDQDTKSNDSPNIKKEDQKAMLTFLRTLKEVL